MQKFNGKLAMAATLDNSQLRKGARESQNIIKGIADNTKKASSSMIGAFKSIGGAIGIAFSVSQATAFAKSIIDVRGEVEALEISFRTLLGKQAGDSLFAEIREFATNTPMGMQEVAKAAQTMLGFQVPAERVMTLLRSIGDIAMGDAQKFQSLALAFSQMHSTGKLMGQDLLQMINAGFNPLAEISRQTGKSIGELKENMDKVPITAKQVEDAFISAASAGGMFHGMLEDQSQAIKGSVAKLDDAFMNLKNELGEKLQPQIINGIQAVTRLVESYEKVGRVVVELIALYGAYRATLITITALEKAFALARASHIQKLRMLITLQKQLNAVMAKNKFAIIATAVVAAGYAIYKFTRRVDEAKKAQEDLNRSMQEINDKIEEQRGKAEQLVNVIKDNNETNYHRKQAFDQLIATYPELLGKIDLERLKTMELTDAIRLLNMERDKSVIKEYEAKAKELENKLFELETKGDGFTFGDVKVLLGGEDTNKMDKIRATQEELNQVNELIATTKEQQRVSKLSTKEKVADLEQRKQANQKYIDAYKKQIDELTSEENKKLYGELSADDKAQVEHLRGSIKGLQEDTAKANEEISKLNEKKEESTGAGVSDAERKRFANEARQRAEAHQRRKEEERRFAEELSKEAFEAQVAIEQARINAIDEGLQKQLDQNKLNFEREKRANVERERAMVEALRDERQAQYELNNKNGSPFDRSSITSKDLAEAQKSQLKEYARIASENLVDANRKALESVLGDVMTYEQRRTKIQEEFARKRKELYRVDADGNVTGEFREGVTGGNIGELDRQESEALKALDNEVAQREVSFQAWMDDLTSQTLSGLEDMLELSELALVELEKQGESGVKVAEARAKVATLKENINKRKAEQDLKPDKRSIEEWDALRSALEEVRGTFEELGQTFVGVAGEILSKVGGIASSTISMINGIVQLANMSMASVKATSEVTSKAIQGVERASVILAIISAALQVAMKIASLFNDDKNKQQQIERLQTEIDSLQWELNNRGVTIMEANGVDSLEMVRDAMEGVNSEYKRNVELLALIRDGMAPWTASAIYNQKLVEASANKLADAYAKVAYTANKALGASRYDNARKDLENIAKQQLLIQKQIDEEASKKKSDSGAINDWEGKIKELGEQAIDIINDLTEDIMGSSAEKMSNDLAEAFFDAFEAGEDAAEAWGKKVDQIVADITKRMLVQKFLEEPLGEIFNKYKDRWFDNGNFVGIDAVVNSMKQMSIDLNAVGADFASIVDALPDSVKNLFDATEMARDASQKGIATASQDSVDELNGRFTAIQGHTYAIMMGMQLLQTNSSSILNSVLNIEMHTKSMDGRLKRIEGEQKYIGRTVGDIKLNGVKAL